MTSHVHLTTHACRHTIRMTKQRNKASPFSSVIQEETLSLHLIVMGMSSELGFRDNSTLNFLKVKPVLPLCILHTARHIVGTQLIIVAEMTSDQNFAAG